MNVEKEDILIFWFVILTIPLTRVDPTVSFFDVQ